MKLNPQQAPLYGDCVLTVLLTEETELEDDVVFYLLFSGSTLKHLTSTRKVNSATLETVTPGHDCSERVKVSLCASKKGFSFVVAEENFEFVQDEAYDSAQFLADNAGNQQALIFARFLDRARPSSGDATVLDDKITLAFRHLNLPTGWNVLGSDKDITDGHLQETLMHFAARLGLYQLAKFLLQQPGGRKALAVHNSEGATPLTLAWERGFQKLHHLLSEPERESSDPLDKDSHTENNGDSCLKHHCELNVYTLTTKLQMDAKATMEKSIDELNKYMENHSHCQPSLKGTDDLDYFCSEKDTRLTLVEKDSKNCKEMESLEVLSEKDCEAKTVQEHCIEFRDEVETVGGDVTVLSSESKKIDLKTKEEEEGLARIVEAENVSASNDHIQSYSTEVHSAVHLLSGGNPNEETEMTSTGIVLDQECLCERDNTNQEMITTKERTTPPDTAVAEAIKKTSDLTKDISVNMGQSLSGYCASNANAIVLEDCEERSEQETGKLEALEKLFENSDNTSVDKCSTIEELSPCLQEQQGIVVSLQTIGSPLANHSDCNRMSSANGGNSQVESLHILSEHLNPISENENPSIGASDDKQLQLLKENHPPNSLTCETMLEEIINAICTELTAEDNTATSKDHTDMLKSSNGNLPQGEAVETKVEFCHFQHADMAEVPAEDGSKDNLANTETSGTSCSENALFQKTDLCYSEIQQVANEVHDGEAVLVPSAACHSTDIMSHSPHEGHHALIEQYVESCVAAVLQDIISKLEKDSSPDFTDDKQQMLTLYGENMKVPPAGQTASLHNENDLSVCAVGEWNKVSDTPSQLSNYEFVQNQEVSAKDFVQSDASSEMQEAAVAASWQQNREQSQLTVCEQGQRDNDLKGMLCETDHCKANDDLLSLSPEFKSERNEDVEHQLPLEDEETHFAVEIENGIMEVNQPESNISECIENKLDIHDGASEIINANEAEITPVIILPDSLSAETSIVACGQEESKDFAKEPPIHCEKSDEESEVVKVPRASLHPIAEELLNGEYSSGTASASSKSEGSSCSSDSEVEFIGPSEVGNGTAETILQSFSHPEVCDVHDVELTATVSLPESPNGLLEAEHGLATVTEVLSDSSTDFPTTLKYDALLDSEEYGVGSLHKEEDSGLDLSGNMEEIVCPSMSDTEIVPESFDGIADDEVDFVKPLQTQTEIQIINRESCCTLEPCSHPDLLESKHSNESTVCERFLDHGLDIESSSQRTLKRGSASDTDLLSSEAMDEITFAKAEENYLCDAASSSSSTDETASLERTSSHGSDISLPHAMNMKKHKDRLSLDSSCSSTMAASVEERESEHTGVSEIEEELDRITEVPAHPSRSKSSMRSLSPFRRHSWEPGKRSGNDAEINRRSSMRVLGEVVRKPPVHRRSMSWCPCDAQSIMGGDFNCRSYSLEGLAGDAKDKKTSAPIGSSPSGSHKMIGSGREDRGSLVSLTEEEHVSDQRTNRHFRHHVSERAPGFDYSNLAPPPHLTKSMSLVTISQPGMEGVRSLNHTSSSMSQSISEESCNQLPTSPSRKDMDGKSGTKVSRTFSYIKHKMSSGKKTKEKEKEKEKTKEKDKDTKEKDKDKKTLNGHLFSATQIVGGIACFNCTKPLPAKDVYLCANCNSLVHKSCRESYTPCAKVKMKGPQPHDSSSLPVIMRNKGSQPKERPRSAIIAPDENTISTLMINRRSQTSLSISKSISTQNIAGIGCDEGLAGTWKVLSQSTDSLHKISKVHESMESLIDEGMDMNEGQLMGEFETDSKQLESESWSQVVDSKFLRQQKKDVVKRQDVIYELMQTEMHHVRTLKIMSDVYSRGMMTELQLEQNVLEKIFPCLDDLLNIHSQFFQRILERKKESMAERSEKNFIIKRIGDILVNQFSGDNGERMKKTYGKFCGHHNEAVNYFKDLHSKEKRFQAFIKKKMSSSVVRRLGIPECILLVTQRITKYPVLLQRILQYTKENEPEHQDVANSLNLVKDVITEVNTKVNNYEKKIRLNDIYIKTDSKSIQRMKSGQMFAKEDLKRRKLVRDGFVFLKPVKGGLKEVLAVLLSDILVFLQEKDQKYVFASLEQRSTVISLKKLIVREVAHEERALFLISMVADTPEMVEVHASSKEERNSWIHIIQDTMNTMDKDDDEGIPSESEEEKRNQDTKARVLKEQLQEKDQQIIELLEEKEKIFQSLTDCCGPEDNSLSVTMGRVLFRANTDDAPKGEPVIKNAIVEVETLQALVSRNPWGSIVQPAASPTEPDVAVGPVSLPRRAETFGGFDSHQLNASKSGEKDEAEDAQDLRRTESDSVLKKGTNTNLMFKRNSEVLQSVTNLHRLLSILQVVVLQQDTYIEDQKLLLNERALTRTSSRPNSLIEQEKQRSMEKQRQELANLQKQQAQHLEEKRKREREWDARERELAEREERLVQREEQASTSMQKMEQEKNELQARKEEYQHDLERLRAAQKQLEKEREQLKEMEKASCQHDKLYRVPSLPVGTDTSKWYSSSSSKQEHLEAELSTSPKKDSLLRTDSKQKGKSHFSLLGTNQTNKTVDAPTPNRLFNLSKPKEKKEKKKKGKSNRSQPADSHSGEGTTQEEEIFC
ncbi:A-kinase anchor protein 13 isoform X2 [Bombina bombina]|uniref:A-kinase anchor protein 13 isoform X2 n=1 Tax=Bombina bombina TaxID=8345 RepID=UPI00235AD2C8|nr:A-kinase anchor protein 13 isoform X2 [Bombina bombina]